MTTATARGAPASAPARSADLILLTAVSLWALNYTVIKFGVSQISPLAFPVLRFGLGGIVLAGVVAWREGTLRIARADVPVIVLAGLLGIGLNQLCFVYSLTDTGASDVALLGASGPLITAFLATVVGVERLGRRHWAGALIGLGGVALIVGGAAGAAFGRSPLLGDGLALGATLFASASVLPVLTLLPRYSATHILTLEMLIGSALLLPLALPALLTQDFGAVTLQGWGALAYSVVFTGVVTNLLYFTAIRRVGPSRAAMFGYLQSFLGVAFAIVLLAEQVTLIQLAGGLVVIGSVVMSRARPGPVPSAARRPAA